VSTHHLPLQFDEIGILMVAAWIPEIGLDQTLAHVDTQALQERRHQ
jgi:hypothetical protein